MFEEQSYLRPHVYNDMIVAGGVVLCDLRHTKDITPSMAAKIGKLINEAFPPEEKDSPLYKKGYEDGAYEAEQKLLVDLGMDG